jgi:hypothetical protein
MARTSELQDQIIRQQNDASEAKSRFTAQLVELSTQRDSERRAAEVAMAEVKSLQQRNGALEHTIGRQNVSALV